MPSLDVHPSTEFVKLLLMGDPGSGKTGALTSLVKAGYKLRIYDFDNLLGSLVQFVRKECPNNISNVTFQTFTDKMEGKDTPLVMNGKSMKVLPFTSGTPNAFGRAMKQLNHWKAETSPGVFEDLGKPSEWGKDTFLIIDSLTTAAAAAFRYVQAMNPGAAEERTYYFAAQQMLMNLIALICSEGVRTNVILIAHVDYEKNHMDLTKGFPRSVGSAINSQIAAYFNSALLVESIGQGTSIRRTIRTNSTGIVELKNPVSFKVPDSLPLETGLATFVEAVRS